MCVCFVLQPTVLLLLCVDYLFGFRLLSTTYNLNSNEMKDMLLAGWVMGQTMTEGRLLVPLFSRFS
jgi:hypothetical protein